MFYVHYLNSLLRLLATDHSNEPNNTALTYFLCKVTRSPRSLSDMTNSDNFRVSLLSYIPLRRNCSESTASFQGKLKHFMVYLLEVGVSGVLEAIFQTAALMMSHSLSHH